MAYLEPNPPEEMFKDIPGLDSAILEKIEVWYNKEIGILVIYPEVDWDNPMALDKWTAIEQAITPEIRQAMIERIKAA